MGSLFFPHGMDHQELGLDADRAADGAYSRPRWPIASTREILPRYEVTAGGAAPVPARDSARVRLDSAAGHARDRGVPEARPVDAVLDTASFYEEYFGLKPKGQNLVQVCRSIACEFCGQPELTCHQGLPGTSTSARPPTTESSRFHRARMPRVLRHRPGDVINETLHENVQTAQIPALLDAARKEHARITKRERDAELGFVEPELAIMPAPNDKSLARSLGQFFGHIFSKRRQARGQAPLAHPAARAAASRGPA